MYGPKNRQKYFYENIFPQKIVIGHKNLYFSPFSLFSGPYVPIFWFYHIIDLESRVFLCSNHCVTPSNSTKISIAQTKQILSHIFVKTFFSKKIWKALKSQISHHFHYFGPFRASFLIFSFNWRIPRLPAFKSPSNSFQLEKIRIFLPTCEKY